MYLSYKADALMLRGDRDGAAKLIDEIVPLTREERLLLPLQILFPLATIVAFNTGAYEAAGDQAAKRAIDKNTRSYLKQIEKYGSRFAFRYPEALRHAGRFCWISGRKKAAMRYWRQGLKISERLAIKPELDRISFEVAKRLYVSGSRYRTMARRSPEHYAKQARDGFAELGLDVDIAELDAWGKGRE